MRITEKISQVCRMRGLSQSRLETLAQLPKNRISKWVAGQGEPTAKQALAIARVLLVDIEWLVDDDADELPSSAITPDEVYLLRVIRDLEIPPDEAVRRIGAAIPSGDPKPVPSFTPIAKALNPRLALIGTQNLTESTRKRMRSEGPSSQPDPKPERPDPDPSPRRRTR